MHMERLPLHATAGGAGYPAATSCLCALPTAAHPLHNAGGTQPLTVSTRVVSRTILFLMRRTRSRLLVLICERGGPEGL